MTTYLLVHGASSGGFLWDDVVARLEARGHRCFAPSLVDVGEGAAVGPTDVDATTHIQQLVDLLDENELTDVVLVGFSYGGYPITGAADARPERVAELIYLDAFVPQPERSFFEGLPDWARGAMEQAAAGFDGGHHAPAAPVEMLGGIGPLGPGIDPDHVAAVLSRRATHPLATYREKMPAFPAAEALPRRYISCVAKPPGDPLVALGAGLRAAGWRVDEIAAGHFAAVTAPDELVELLDPG